MRRFPPESNTVFNDTQWWVVRITYFLLCEIAKALCRVSHGSRSAAVMDQNAAFVLQNVAMTDERGTLMHQFGILGVQIVALVHQYLVLTEQNIGLKVQRDALMVQFVVLDTNPCWSPADPLRS